MRYAKYKKTGIEWLPQVPAEWEVKKVRQCFNLRSQKVSEEDYAPLSVAKMGIVPKLEDAAISLAEGDTRKLVRKNDYVVNSRSDRKGSCGIAPCDGSVTTISIVLEPKNVVPRYIHYLFRSTPWVEEFYRNGRGIVADLWTTRYQEMRNMQFPYPPLAEQEKIVKYLDEKCGKIDEAVKAKEREVELLKECRQSLIAEAVTKGVQGKRKMKDSGVAWIGKVPVEWEVKRLKLNLVANDGGVWGDDPRGDDTDTFVLRSTEQQLDGSLCIESPAKRKLTEAEIKKALLEENDLIVTKSSGSKDHIGKTSIIDAQTAQLKCCYSNFLQRLRVKGCPKLYWYLLNSAIAKMQLELMATTTTGLNNLTASIIGNLQFPCPTLAEQEKIVKYLDEKCGKIDEAVKAKEHEVELLKELKQSVIAEAVTGQRKVA